MMGGGRNKRTQIYYKFDCSIECEHQSLIRFHCVVKAEKQNEVAPSIRRRVVGEFRFGR